MFYQTHMAEICEESFSTLCYIWILTVLMIIGYLKTYDGPLLQMFLPYNPYQILFLSAYILLSAQAHLQYT